MCFAFNGTFIRYFDQKVNTYFSFFCIELSKCGFKHYQQASSWIDQDYHLVRNQSHYS